MPPNVRVRVAGHQPSTKKARGLLFLLVSQADLSFAFMCRPEGFAQLGLLTPIHTICGGRVAIPIPTPYILLKDDGPSKVLCVVFLMIIKHK